MRQGNEGAFPCREKKMGSLLKLKAVDFCMQGSREKKHPQEGLQES